jgi:hypothetical protein
MTAPVIEVSPSTLDHVVFDSPEQRSGLVQGKSNMILLNLGCWMNGGEALMYAALILERVGLSEKTYRRVGLVTEMLQNEFVGVLASRIELL